MVGLDVRVDVRAVLAGVGAVRALEARRLAALVLEVPVQSAVPLVGLATLGTLEVAARRSERPAAVSSSTTGGRRHVAGATVESCKSTGRFVSRVWRFTAGKD